MTKVQVFVIKNGRGQFYTGHKHLGGSSPVFSHDVDEAIELSRDEADLEMASGMPSDAVIVLSYEFNKKEQTK